MVTARAEERRDRRPPAGRRHVVKNRRRRWSSSRASGRAAPATRPRPLPKVLRVGRPRVDPRHEGATPSARTRDWHVPRAAGFLYRVRNRGRRVPLRRSSSMGQGGGTGRRVPRRERRRPRGHAQGRSSLLLRRIVTIRLVDYKFADGTGGARPPLSSTMASLRGRPPRRRHAAAAVRLGAIALRWPVRRRSVRSGRSRRAARALARTSPRRLEVPTRRAGRARAGSGPPPDGSAPRARARRERRSDPRSMDDHGERPRSCAPAEGPPRPPRLDDPHRERSSPPRSRREPVARAAVPRRDRRRAAAVASFLRAPRAVVAGALLAAALARPAPGTSGRSPAP